MVNPMVTREAILDRQRAAKYPGFSRGGGREVSQALGVPFLGEIPLDPAVRKGGDTGAPIVVADPESPQGGAFCDLAERIRRAADGAAEHVPTLIVR